MNKLAGKEVEPHKNQFDAKAGVGLSKKQAAEKKFCVYTHARSSDGVIFYVGKGTIKRATKGTGRGIWWHRVEKKHGKKVNIVFRTDIEADAFSVERALIRAFKSVYLANQTDGGEGTSGRVSTPAQKLAASTLRKGEAPSKKCKDAQRKACSKPVGTVCGLRFESAADAAKKMFPDNILSARTCISASCNGAKVSNAFGYKFRFVIDGVWQKSTFKPNPPGKRILRSDGAVFKSAMAALEPLISNGWTKAQNSNLVQCCKGKVKSAYGFGWSYYDV